MNCEYADNSLSISHQVWTYGCLLWLSLWRTIAFSSISICEDIFFSVDSVVHLCFYPQLSIVLDLLVCNHWKNGSLWMTVIWFAEEYSVVRHWFEVFSHQGHEIPTRIGKRCFSYVAPFTRHRKQNTTPSVLITWGRSTQQALVWKDNAATPSVKKPLRPVHSHWLRLFTVATLVDSRMFTCGFIAFQSLQLLRVLCKRRKTLDACTSQPECIARSALLLLRFKVPSHQASASRLCSPAF